MEFGLAMADCDKCIELNPMFIKGYLRKAAVLKIDKPAVSAITYQLHQYFKSATIGGLECDLCAGAG